MVIKKFRMYFKKEEKKARMVFNSASFKLTNF